MRNPEATKETILKKSGVLFNTSGYKATSLSEITDATGLTKGAIYRHFESKDRLERETMSYLSGQMFEKMRVVIKSAPTAGDKLRAIFSFFESYISHPPFKGGCPLMNASIEADDAHPGLKKEALKTMTIMRESIVHILKQGIENDQIKPGIDKEFYATLTIAALEGGIMMSKLENNDHDIRRVIKHLRSQLEVIEL